MQTSLPTKYTENGLEFADGTQIPADLIVFATGFVGNLRTLVSSLFGPEVANQLDDYWGMDDEGELKGAFKQSGRKYLPYSSLPMFGAISELLLSPMPVPPSPSAKLFWHPYVFL